MKIKINAKLLSLIYDYWLYRLVVKGARARVVESSGFLYTSAFQIICFIPNPIANIYKVKVVVSALVHVSDASSSSYFPHHSRQISYSVTFNAEIGPSLIGSYPTGGIVGILIKLKSCCSAS